MIILIIQTNKNKESFILISLSSELLDSKTNSRTNSTIILLKYKISIIVERYWRFWRYLYTQFSRIYVTVNSKALSSTILILVHFHFRLTYTHTHITGSAEQRSDIRFNDRLYVSTDTALSWQWYCIWFNEITLYNRCKCDVEKRTFSCPVF